MNEHVNEDFRAQVDRLVAEGKLTPEEAAGLLGGETAEPVGEALASAPVLGAGSGTDEPPPDLDLRVNGYNLTVVHDAGVARPSLNVNREGELTLTATPQGWRVDRVPRQQGHWPAVQAILSVPFAPRQVRARIHGGNLTLPDIGGEMVAGVNGGNIRMGRAASLQADVNGGNLTATEMGGPTRLTVNGGNLTLAGARSLNASVNGGNLRWAGHLTGGDHRVEVNAGNATLELLPGSSVEIAAEVTVGAFKADFPTTRSGGMLNTHHSGRLGGGEARLSCRVTAGQLRVVSE